MHIDLCNNKKLILNNKASAIINTVWQRCVFFSIFGGQKIDESCPKNSKCSQNCSGKTYFPQFSQKTVFHFVKIRPKNYAANRQEHKPATFAQLFKTNTIPYMYHVYWGFLHSCWNTLHQCTFPTTHSSENYHSYPDILSGADISCKQKVKL
jgi:hypothetical protein